VLMERDLSLRAYMEELSASFNAQDQAPDDFHAQDRQCDPYIFVEYFRIKDKIPQGYPRRRTVHTFPFSRSLETGHRNSLHATYHALTRVFRGLSFLCVVFGFQWLVRVCFVL
jgi:hypothetical protein